MDEQRDKRMITAINRLPNSQSFLLDGVAFYGRTLSEYMEMFDFQPEDWHGKRILDCNSGPSSFSAESNRIGINTVACDPLYEHTLQTLIPRAESDLERCLHKPESQRHLFEAAASDSQSFYGTEKQRAIFNFSRDYSQGKAEGRYIAAALPELPFASNSFDLVLSAHFLFVYATKDNGGLLDVDHFPLEFHIAAIKELLRVSRNELRIYPLKGPNRSDNPLLQEVLQWLKEEPVDIEFRSVSYKDIVGANTMLKIQKKKV